MGMICVLKPAIYSVCSVSENLLFTWYDLYHKTCYLLGMICIIKPAIYSV
jgi:hypothetical protein